jgi:hydroxymethylglutaryl-CoA lyase
MVPVPAPYYLPMPHFIRITDVSPRDGLQNEPSPVSTADKARLVRALIPCGLDEIEVSSFVSAKWVPQLGDAAELFAELAGEVRADVAAGGGSGGGDGSGDPGRPIFSALVPNEKGMAAALEVNRRAGGKVISKVAVFTAASETFSHRNTNGSITETLKRFEPVVALAREHDLLVRGYVSCAIECPFEGEIAPGKVAQVAQALHDMGCDEVALGDTIGAAEPETITLLMHAMLARFGDEVFEFTTLHLHDTFGRAAECVAEALAIGVRSFDGAVGGLGGCPYASTKDRRAPGNIGTELLVQTVLDAGFETRVDLSRLREARRIAREVVDRGESERP